jgi:hypothetical protein
MAEEKQKALAQQKELESRKCFCGNQGVEKCKCCNEWRCSDHLFHGYCPKKGTRY